MHRLAALLLASGATLAQQTPPDPVSIGQRLELFFDDELIERSSHLERVLHRPEPAEVVLVTDRPWEGNISAYFTVLADNERLRMYYRGAHYEAGVSPRREDFTCYAESLDGIHWERPDLGLVEFEGSTANNILLRGPGVHCFTPFRDDRPGCSPERRYKAFSAGDAGEGYGLLAFASPDGVRWTLLDARPLLTEGAFDSQNLALWDPVSGDYVAYYRGKADGVRTILTSRSKDFLQWTAPVELEYPGAPVEQMYTNAIRLHPEAPHLYLGFPTRYRPGTKQVEPLFMAGRDGRAFHRFADPVIPITAPEDRDGNRSNYMANALVELPGRPDEWSVYATEAYYEGSDSRLRRFVYRRDGFVSLRAADRPGELITVPLTFEGNALVLNYACQADGNLRAELRTVDDTPIPGFELDACVPMTGDRVQARVAWRRAPDLAALAGRPVVLRLVLRNADLYSLRFTADGLREASPTGSR